MMGRLLYWLSGWLRCRIIGRETVYLERYFLFRVPSWVPLIGGAQGYLHRFLKSDYDPRPHDHPWAWAITWILSCGYIEKRLFAFDPAGPVVRARRRWPGQVGFIGPLTFHRVVLCGPKEDREAWTLFIHGRHCKRWGFLDALKPKPRAGIKGLWLCWTAHKEAAGGGAPWWRDVPLGRDEPQRVPRGGRQRGTDPRPRGPGRATHTTTKEKPPAGGAGGGGERA